MSSATTPIRLKVAADLGVTAGTIGLGNVENKSSATIRSEIVAANLAGAGKPFAVLPASGATVGAAIGVNFTGQFTTANIANFFAAKVITAGIIDVTDLFAQAISVTDTVKVGSDTSRYLLTLDGRGTASPIAIIDKNNAGALVFGFDSDDKPYFGGGLRDGAIDSVNVFTDEVLTQLKPIVVGSTGGIFKVTGLPSMIGATLNKTVTVTPANPSAVLIGLSFSDYFLNIASSVNLNFTPPKYMVTIKRSLNGGTATTIHSQMYTGTALNQRDPEVNKWECSFAINVDIAISDINHAANNNDSITYTFTVTRSSGAYSAAKITAASCSQQTQGGGTAGVASQLTAPYVGLTASGNPSYPAMTLENSPTGASGWIRTPTTGLLPYASGGGSSNLGSASWPFATIYGQAVYDNNNRVYSASNPNIGTGSTNYAAGNHDHSSISGNASSATLLQTARTIGISGAVTGTATSFNGGANITISATAVNASNLNAGTVPDARISGSYTGLANLTGSGTVDFAKFLGNAGDTVGAPSFSWTGDLDTGMYWVAADQVGISTGGVQRALFNSSGVTAATFNGALNGNASTATVLQTARTISLAGDVTGSVSFNGSANVSISAVVADKSGIRNQYVDFTVGGDANTYYPVLIGAGASAFAFDDLSISRVYNWPAPTTWNNSTHKGGLTLTLGWSSDSAWGGNDKTLRVKQFNETYSTTVAGLHLSVSGLLVWLRGGGAQYRLHSLNGQSASASVTLGTYTDAAGTAFPVRTTTSSNAVEIYSRMPVRRSADIYDQGSRVYSPNNTNIGTGATNYAAGTHDHSSISGNAATATTLATARTIAISGAVTGTATSFNGGANITIAATALNASNLSAGTVPDARISGSYTGLTNLTGSGTVDFSRFFGNATDTVAAPSFSWTTDTDTGIYSPAADQLAITTGGVQRALFSSAGVTAATFSGALSGNATTATTLQTARTIAISGAVTGTATSFNGGANITIAATALNASNLSAGTVPDARISGSYTGLANLTGTGTVDFAKFLGNAGDTVASPSFSWTGDLDTGIYQPAADQIGFATGGVSRGVFDSAGLDSLRVRTTGTGNDYASGGVEIRGNGTTDTVYPTLGFHQPNKYAASIQLRGASDFRFYAQGASAYANVTAGNVVANGTVHANGGLVQKGNVILNGSDTWLRTTGATGWHSATYGGGMYMSDTTWVRTFGGKKFFVENSSEDAIYTSGGVTSLGPMKAKSWGTGNVGAKVMTWDDFLPANPPAGLQGVITANWLAAGVVQAKHLQVDGISENGGVRTSFKLQPAANVPIRFSVIDGSNNLVEDIFAIDNKGNGFFKGKLSKNTVDINAIDEETRKMINPYYLTSTAGSKQELTASVAMASGALVSLPTITSNGKTNVSWKLNLGSETYSDTGSHLDFSMFQWRVDIYRGPTTTPVFSKTYDGYSATSWDPASVKFKTVISLNIEDLYIDTDPAAAKIFSMRVTKISGTANAISRKYFGADSPNFITNDLDTNEAGGFSWTDKETGFTVKSGSVSVPANTTLAVTYTRAFSIPYSCSATAVSLMTNEWGSASNGIMAAGGISVTNHADRTTTINWIATGYTG